ncbi:unnamed protein product [Adineta steineri]|uniref:Uncharacterized protein n=1 Tax=Adineta steineri TaxID=433720 RepID=A0A819MT74_9BILA|nr:unnamed protein product [Adineta steineri]
MKLKAIYGNNIFLVPTLDIELVWQVHLSRPEIYRNDCLRLFAAKCPPAEGHDFMPLTYAIDCIWRSHMQKPLNYILDCYRLVKYVINRIPHRSNNIIEVMEHNAKINDIWKEEFDSDIITDHLFRIHE